MSAAVPTVTELPFTTRIWFAWVCFFKVLFDGRFAAYAYAPPALAAPKDEAPPAKPAAPAPKAPTPSVPPPAPSTDAALQLLALLQREGRFVDFVEEDIAGAEDAQIGAAARVVHAGCRKALREHLELAAVRSEDEGAAVTLAAGFDPSAIKLTGNVAGAGPYSGTLRHRGWKVTKVSLPTPIEGHDARVVAQAEVEL